MFPGSTKLGGQAMGTPDVCKTPAPPAPPVPIPYPNIAQMPTAMGFATKVKLSMGPALTLQSQVPMTQGDEAGVAGGVVSGMNMGPMTYKKGSAKVIIQGAPAVYLTSITGHNGSNANMPAGQQIAPSQTKVMIAP